MSWLLDHLIASGHVTETGLTRRARIRTCRETKACRAQVLAGLDNDTCAFEVAADPQPLSRLGEAMALLEHRRTFTLRREGPGYVLDPRDAGQITWAPAATQQRQDVVRQHRCATPPPTSELAAPTGFPEAAPRPPANSTPPF